MEKLDFTPDEYRAYREEHGLGWPPPDGFARMKAILDDMRARYPDFDLAQIARRYADQVFRPLP